MKNIKLILSVLSISIISNYAQYNFPDYGDFIQVEKLVYSVHWTFIRIGTITIKTEVPFNTANKDVKKVTMIIESNPYIPFVDIEEFNESIINAADGMSRNYFGIHNQEGREVEISCIYDPMNNNAYYTVKNSASGIAEVKDTISIVDKYVDGPSLFNYTRMVADSGCSLNVPTMIKGKISNTLLDFCGPIENIDIDAVDLPVRTLQYKGIADWEEGGAAGLSGDFTGWISDDSASIIVKAEMEVFLGSIVVELEEWINPGWIPPVQSLTTNNLVEQEIR